MCGMRPDTRKWPPAYRRGTPGAVLASQIRRINPASDYLLIFRPMVWLK